VISSVDGCGDENPEINLNGKALSLGVSDVTDPLVCWMTTRKSLRALPSMPGLPNSSSPLALLLDLVIVIYPVRW